MSEYAPEGSLKDWLHRNGGMARTVDETVALGTGILAGLGHLHSRNVIHGDLKPANILLQGNLPRIADFGLSLVLCPTSSSRRVAGTPAYMAPEAWDGDRCVESDLWAVGVMLYEMLLGYRPFSGTSQDKLCEAIRWEQLPELSPTIPAAVRNAVTKALQKKKKQRFVSAEEMKAVLEGRHVPRRAAEEPPSSGVWQAEQLEAQLRDRDPRKVRERAKAARELGQLTSVSLSAARALCGACDDPSEVVRAALVKALRNLLVAGGDRTQVRAEVMKQLQEPTGSWCLEQLQSLEAL